VAGDELRVLAGRGVGWRGGGGIGLMTGALRSKGRDSSTLSLMRGGVRCEECAERKMIRMAASPRPSV
jgi:hypothetical protein